MNGTDAPAPEEVRSETTPPHLFTAADREKDPEFEKVKKQLAEQTAKMAKQIEDRLLDIPFDITIGGETYSYTSRPLGYLTLIFREFMALRDIFASLKELTMTEIEKETTNTEPTPLVTETDVLTLFASKGEEGIKVMVGIAQLLVEPIDSNDPKPPPPSDKRHLPMETAIWGLTASKFARLLSEFFARDLILSGVQVRNLMSLSPEL